MAVHNREQRQAGYRPPTMRRVVIMMRSELLTAVDAWGVPAGMRSRTAAINKLIEKGMEAYANEQRQAT